MPHTLLTAREVCARLRISERKLRQLVADREISVIRSGRWLRFEESSLTEFIEAARVPSVRTVAPTRSAPPDADYLDELVAKHRLG